MHRTCLLVFTGLLLLASVAQCVQRDPYQVLGVRRSATQKEITRAFRTLSRQYHPDKNPSKGATAKFQEISAAYDYLTDPARQNKPWEWDFSDGASSGKGGRGRRGPYTAYDAFDAFQGTYHFVLDLDPMRIISMARTWFEQHTEKHHHMYEQLWRSSIDQAVCQALQSGWKLPRLLEPPLMYLVRNKIVTGYQPGQWRSWASSGILLELGFWVARQTPCLQYVGSSSSSDAASSSSGAGSEEHGSRDDVKFSSAHAGPVTAEERLVELQQQLHSHRKLRQQLLHSSSSTKAKQRSKSGGKATSSSKSSSSSSRSSKSSSSSGDSASIMIDGFDADLSQLQLLQGRLLWWALLIAGGYLVLHDRQMVLVGFGLVAAGLWSLLWGVGGSEGAVEALQAALDANSWNGWLIGVWYTAACASLCLLLPLVLASCLLLLATLLWATVSCSSIAMTPCVSRFGLAAWIALQLWFYSGGQLLQGGALALGVCLLLYKRPSLGIWWVTLLFSPVLFVWHLLRIFFLSWGNWLGLTNRSPELAAKIAASVLARRAQAKLQDQPQPQQQQEQHDAEGEAADSEANGVAAAADGSASRKRARTTPEPTSTSPNRTAAAAAALPAAAAAQPTSEFGSVGAYPPKANLRRRAARAGYVTIWSIFNGPWWPGTFSPIDLAFCCYWWIRMVGWVLPLRVLLAAVIACKVAFMVAAFAMATAAFEAAGSWLTVGSFVQIVLLKLGAGVGVLWVGSIMLDDLARIIDPVKWARRQQQKLQRRGKSPRLWQQQHKRNVEMQRRQQQQRQGPQGGLGLDASCNASQR